jgi:tetratricopeptide (TPR) repeat protein
MPEMFPRRFGKYILLESIATGGVAQLFLGKITGLQGFEKLVAIKTILPHLTGEKDLVKAFIDEAKVAALLSHPNIAQIYDFGLMENTYFIAMEYLFGKDLRHIFQKAKEKEAPLGLGHALYITARICSGLGYAHRLADLQGKPLHLIHRDISPQNILITYGGEVKIVDFGIAKAAGQSSTTQHGSIKGKVAYMSPEQASGEKIDQRSDIFSTGILLYEMLTQKRMFTGDTMEILEKVRKTEFEPAERVVENLPPLLYNILDRALTKDVNQRYQFCGEMQGAVEECMFDLSLRPDAQALGEYMKKLFGQEMEAEGERISNESACLNVGQEGEALGTDLQFMEEILGKAKAISAEEETATWRQPKLLYGALAGSILVIVILAWALLFRGTPMNAADEGPLPIESIPEAVDSDMKAPSGNPIFSGEGPKTDHAALARRLVDKAAGLIENDPGQAKSLLQKAVELDPRSADAYFNLGYVYAMGKDYPKAEKMYRQAVKLAPSYLDEALFNLALVQEKQGKKKQSMESLERAAKINPQNEMAINLLKKLKGVL